MTGPITRARLNSYDRAAAAAVALMLVAGAAIFLYAPTDALQGNVQRIFYLHVSAAIAAYGSFAVVLVGGLIYCATAAWWRIASLARGRWWAWSSPRSRS